MALLTISQNVMSDGFRISPLKLQFGAESKSTLVKVSDGRQKLHTGSYADTVTITVDW
jgi:spore coat protein U-like protein